MPNATGLDGMKLESCFIGQTDETQQCHDLGMDENNHPCPPLVKNIEIWRVGGLLLDGDQEVLFVALGLDFSLYLRP